MISSAKKDDFCEKKSDLETLNKKEMKHFSEKFVISRVFMVKGPEIWFVISKVC